MTSCFDREDGTFRVLVNHEEQYSIWPDWKAIPKGWRDTGVLGDKKFCLEQIEKVWTDMRPLSLRRFMDEQSIAKTS
jgi:MbtH protein